MKKNKDFFYRNLLDRRKEIERKCISGGLVRTADQRNVFSKGDISNWTNELYKITEIVNDTITTYHMSNVGKANSLRSEHFHESYGEALLGKSELTLNTMRNYQHNRV